MNNKVKAGIAATVVAASIATNLSFTPEELLRDAAELERQQGFVSMDGTGDDGVAQTAPAVNQSLGERVRGWFLRLPVVVKAVFLLPMWAAGAIPVSIVTAAISGSSPVLSALLSFALQVGVLFGVFCVVYKLIFPQRKATELFKKKNRRWIFLGAGALTLTNLVLAQCWSGWPLARVIIIVAAGLGVLCLLWYRVCQRRKKKERAVPAEEKEQKLKLEF